jgi:hypothetical protein
MGPGTPWEEIEMTDLSTTTRPNTQISVEPSPAPAQTTSVAEPTLITEQQVMFSTAAAVALPAKTHRWTDVLVSFAAAVRRAAGPPQPVQGHHSERYLYLQNALMSREMDRL